MWCHRTTISHTRSLWHKARTTIKNASTLASFILHPIILWKHDNCVYDNCVYDNCVRAIVCMDDCVQDNCVNGQLCVR